MKQINEAFASQWAYCLEHLQVPIEKVNPKYVAKFLNHEKLLTSSQRRVYGLDASTWNEYVAYVHSMFHNADCDIIAGVRQVVTGLAELRRRDEKILLTSMCIGSGMGGAAVFVNEARP